MNYSFILCRPLMDNLFASNPILLRLFCVFSKAAIFLRFYEYMEISRASLLEIVFHRHVCINYEAVIFVPFKF